jgi:hypothetical protein
MSVAELKEEALRQFAIKVSSTNDEKVLEMILDFVKGINSDDKNGINLSRHYDAIKAKYGTVLQKLAQ